MFLYLPSTLDRKEDLNQWSEDVNLPPIDISQEELRALNGNQDFQPEDLNNSSKRNKITKIFYSFMKEVAAASNHNLVRNSNAFFRNLMGYSIVNLDIQANPMPFFDNMLKGSSTLRENLKFIQGLDIYVFLFRVFWFACILILLWRRYLILM